MHVLLFIYECSQFGNKLIEVSQNCFHTYKFTNSVQDIEIQRKGPLITCVPEAAVKIL